MTRIELAQEIANAALAVDDLDLNDIRTRNGMPPKRLATLNERWMHMNEKEKAMWISAADHVIFLWSAGEPIPVRT